MGGMFIASAVVLVVACVIGAIVGFVAPSRRLR